MANALNQIRDSRSKSHIKYRLHVYIRELQLWSRRIITLLVTMSMSHIARVCVGVGDDCKGKTHGEIQANRRKRGLFLTCIFIIEYAGSLAGSPRSDETFHAHHWLVVDLGIAMTSGSLSTCRDTWDQY